jgi:hypothetical protein
MANFLGGTLQSIRSGLFLFIQQHMTMLTPAKIAVTNRLANSNISAFIYCRGFTPFSQESCRLRVGYSTLLVPHDGSK